MSSAATKNSAVGPISNQVNMSVALEAVIPTGEADGGPFLVAWIPEGSGGVFSSLFDQDQDWKSFELLMGSCEPIVIPLEVGALVSHFDPYLLRALNLVIRLTSFGSFLADSFSWLRSISGKKESCDFRISRIRQFVSCWCVRCWQEFQLTDKVVGPLLAEIRSATKELRPHHPSAFDEVIDEVSTLTTGGSFGDSELSSAFLREIILNGERPSPEQIARLLDARLEDLAEKFVSKHQPEWLQLRAACTREAYACRHLRPAIKVSTTSVQLRGRNENPIVFGKEVGPLSTIEYDVVEKLVTANGQGVNKGELDQINPDAVNRLAALKKKAPDSWGKAILFPGGKGKGGYKIATGPFSD